MLHPFLNPQSSSLPSRLVFAKGPRTGGASGGSTGDTSVESINNLPAAGTPEELRLRLAALEGQVSQEEARNQLQGLRGNMELQQQAQAQEAREVNYVISKLRTNLEDAPERQRVMTSIQNRLVLELAVLAEDGEITEAQLAPNTLEATLQNLDQRKGSIKVRSSAGERNLYAYEQNMLTVPGLLKNHSNDEVKQAWEQMGRSMRNNVRAMRASAAVISGGTAGQSITGRASAAVTGLVESVTDRWKNGSNTDRALMIAGAAAAGFAIFKIGKWLFGGRESSSSRVSGRSILGLLGIGGLIAGGVYLYNRLKSPLAAFNSLRDLIPGMTREQFQTGLAAHMAGNETAARAAWGEHYDVLAGRLGGRPTSPDSSSEEVTVGGEKVKMVPVREALKNYGNEVKEALFPIKNLFDNNPETRNLVLLYLSATHHAAILGGFSMTAAKAMAFAKLAVTAPAHPLRSLMIITAFLLAKEADENLKLPESSDALKRYLTGFIRERSNDINDFIEQNDLGVSLSTEQLSLSAQYLTGDRDVKELQPTALELIGDVVDNTIDYLRLEPHEKEVLRSRTGMRNLRDRLVNYRMNEEGLSDEDKQKTEELSQYLSQLLRNMRERNITETELTTLIEKGRAARVGVKRENGTLYWGYTNENGDFLDDASLMGLGIDPGASDSERLLASNNFMVDQSSVGQVVTTAISRTLSERGRNTVAGAIDLVKNQNGMVLWDGAKFLVVDTVTNAFWEIPGSLKDYLIGKLTGDEHAADVGFKNFSFAYAGGLASYMVIGGRRALNPMRFKALWEAAGLRGVAKPFLETAFWPLTVANRSQAFARSRVLNPLLRDSGLGYRGVMGIAGETGSRWLNNVKSVFGGSRNKNAYISLSKLHRGLADIRRAETLALEVGGRREAREIVERVRRILGDAGEDLAVIANKLSNTDMVHNARLLNNGIKNGTEAFTLRAGMDEIRRAVNAGQQLQPEHFSRLRQLVGNTHLKEELRSFLGNIDSINPNQADELIRLLSTEEGVVQAASRLERLGLISSADEALRAAQEGGEAARSSRLRTLFTDTLQRGRAWWAARGIDNVTDSMRASAETLDSIRRGSDVSGEAILALKNSPDGELQALLRAAGASDESLGRLSSAIRRGSFDDIAVAMRETNFIIDAAEESAGTLRRALDALGNGAELGLQKLGSIKQALSGAPDSAAYKAVANKLDSLAGMTASTKNTIINAFKNNVTIENLKRALGAAGQVFIKIKEGISGATRFGVEVGGEVAARLGSAIARLKGRLPLSAIDIVSLRSALMNTGSESYRIAREALSSMYHFGRHHVIALEQILTAPRNFPGGRQLKQLIEATGIWKVADEVAQMDDVLRAGSEGLQSTRGLSHVFEGMRTGRALGANDLNTLIEAAKNDDFADALRRSGVAAEHADEIADACKNQKNLSRLQDALEGTGVMKFSDEVSGIARIGRVLGPIAILAGAGMNAFDAYSRYQMAQAFKDNPEAYAYMKGQSYAVGAAAVLELTIDIGTLGANAAAYGTLGARVGQGFTTALRPAAAMVGMGAATLGSIMATLGPQIVITAGIESLKYMVVGALEARAEVARNADDWKNDAIRRGFASSGVRLNEGEAPNEFQTELITAEAVNILIHELMGTTVETNAGEAYDSVFTTNTIKGYGIEKGNTRLKIVDALVTLLTPGRPQEYKQYFFNYFAANTNSLNIASFQEGKSIIAQATMFADYMQNRNRTLTLATGVNTQESLVLSEEKYNADQISAENITKIRRAAGTEANNSLRAMLGDSLYNRINGLDENYLNYSLSVMTAYLREHPDDALSQRSQRMMEFILKVTPVLQFGGYQVKIDNDIMYPDEDIEDIEKALFEEDLSDEDLAASLGPYQAASPAIAAFYALAKAFGFQGYPNYAQLKLFFSEAKKDRFGIYWDGDEWNVNENNGDDDGTTWIMADSPENAIQHIIAAYRDPSDDVIISRNDYALDFRERDYQRKAMDMMRALAGVMQSAYDSHVQTLPEVPETAYEDQSPTMAALESLNDSAVETLDSATGGYYSSTVNTVRDGVGSVVGAIGGLFSSDDDD